jgi:signal transduction histidine kinase
LLARAVLNVLENAAAHVGPAVRIAVTCRHEFGGATIAIEDDGPGVSDRLAPDLFQRFRRGDTAPTGGNGLGLAIVDAVMRGHGGHVGLASPRTGRGARFELRFPATRPVGQNGRAVEGSEPSRRP